MIRANKYSDASIISYLHLDDIYWDDDLIKLKDLMIKYQIQIDDLIKAMVLGYRVKPKNNKRKEIQKIIVKYYGFEVAPERIVDEIKEVVERTDIEW